MLPPSRGVKMLKKKTRAEVNLNELFLALVKIMKNAWFLRY